MFGSIPLNKFRSPLDLDRVVLLQARTRKQWKQKWRRMLFLWTTLTSLVFLAHCIALTQFHKGPYGLGVLHTSLDCSSVRRRHLHGSLLLNFIATSVFVSSNYAMQCLASPTRAEIDSAHSRLQSMDIGRQSLRNLWRVKWSRKLVWLVLAASGVPLHML